MFVGTLKGSEEYIFRQSVLGGIAHIAVDTEDYEIALRDESKRENLYIATWCGREYKYNPKYSSMMKRNGVVRNACEYCFTEYDPDERPDRKAAKQEERRKRKVYQDNLPF